MATETQHQLDLVIDVKRPHWQIVQDILGLYKSAPLYSDGKYKIITDRADLPVRQVFHAGNMVGRAEVRIGKDPAAVNQLTAEFANRSLSYERDVYVLQDSAEVFGLNAPIKNADTSLIGLTRPTEVARRLDFEMQRRRQQVREVTFQTGLEAIAVEPGDHCIVGVLMTDFEMGYGGRVLDGSTTSFIADREVTLNPGSNYDLWLWHSDADTPEQRTLVGSTTHIRIAPAVPFNFRANSGDRFAIGVQSEDLILAAVKRVTHNENGVTQIVADEYIPITVKQDCPNSVFATFAPNIPSQPNASATFTGSNCQACFAFTYTGCQGGLTTGVLSDALGFNSGFAHGAAVLNGSLHPPVYSILVGNTLSFVSGANSGRSTYIFSYYVGSPSQFGLAVFEIMPSAVASGTAYFVSFNTSVSGFRVDVSTNGTSMSPIGTFFGNSGCVEVTGVGTSSYARAVPFNNQDVFNQAGTWVFSMNTAGCFNLEQGPASSPASLTTQSLTNLFAVSIPGSLMELGQSAQMRVVGLVNDTCVASESTKVSFGLVYVASTVINSLVIDLRTGSLSVGTNAPFVLKATFDVLTVPSTPSVRVALEYIGAAAGITQVSTLLFSGVMSINFSVAQSMAFTVHQSHTDTTGAVHSHGCHSVVLDHAEFEIFGTIGA